ncbi:ABC transporter permease [Chitinivorax sp. B]|uniref:ABC transporter permease n=1 Tax=Chitinivorax sp. B TaxID=2502235 RepID=UPI0010FA3D05|nr:ABC transporter permease [Chitinivorax sp. B]
MLGEYLPSILDGAWVTLKIAFGSLIVATILGLIGAAAKLASNRFIAWWGEAYSTLIRGVPDLVLMLLLFFGGQIIINDLVTYFNDWMVERGSDYALDFVDVDPFLAGMLTIGFIFGAYLSETFRGAIMAVPKGQSEAGVAFGMSRSRVFFRIVVPQMIRFAIPSFSNNWLVLLKTTALVSVIGLQDMMKRADAAGKATQQPFTFFLFVAGMYLLFTTVSILVLRWVEKRYSAGVRTGEL